MVGLAKIKILAAGLRQSCREFRQDNPAEQRQHTAEEPHTQNQKRRVNVQGNDIGIDENARADDASHDDHGGVERVQASRWGWRGQGREDNRTQAAFVFELSCLFWLPDILVYWIVVVERVPRPSENGERLAPIISARGLAKRFGVAPLFRSISFTVSEGERIGIIGPNGSGKSTLLAILQGSVSPDSGDVAIRKGTRLNSVLQMSEFAEGETVRAVVNRAFDDAHVPESDRAARMAEILGRAGFADLLDADASKLSGGWRKRLAIVEGLVQAPDILLLDEPTNHLDLAGIQWLESVLQNGSFACVVVSHDRYFLENVANEVVELN